MPGESGEKTEKATPRKRKKAREEGQVRKSQDVNTAVLLSVGFAVISLIGPSLLQSIFNLVRNYVGGDRIPRGTFQIPDVAHLVGSLIVDFLLAIAPLAFVLLVAAIGVNLLQFGFMFSKKALKPKFSKSNPLKGLKRMISMQTLVTLLKNLMKVAVIGVVVYSEYVARFPMFPNYMSYPLAEVASEIFSICISLAIKACVVLIIIAAFDFIYQWFSYEKKLKMTKQEVKDEYKMTEGDPKIKSKIKQTQRKMSMMRMMNAVPTADVVITNPTHYAVALKYDEKLGDAPVVLAKGADHMAQKIKERALEALIPIVEDKPVAQALYAAVEVGQAIPAEMFAVVAEILARVYKSKQERKYASAPGGVL